MNAPVHDDSEFLLDRARVRRSFGKAAGSYDAVAVLQAEVRRRHLERLDFVRLEPRVVLDVGSGTGAGALALKRRYPRARVTAFDLAMGMLLETGRRQTLVRRFARVCGDAGQRGSSHECHPPGVVSVGYVTVEDSVVMGNSKVCGG